MTVEARKHAAIAGLEYRNGCLVWGGVPVPEIASRAGQTPFYAYARSRMSDRVGELKKAMPDALSLHYAMKANPMPAVVEHMVGLVDGLDVASRGELEVALATGIDSTKISFAGPGKSDAELHDAIVAGITVNIESGSELRRIAAASEHLGRRARVAIRVNPDFELKSAGMKMGGRPSQFGVDAEHVPALLEELGDMNLEFIGFHVFSGSQNLRCEAICESMQKTVELVSRLGRNAPSAVRSINLGGGLGIPYFPHEQPVELAPIGAAAADAIDRLRSVFGPVEVVMELGRYLVGEAGIYVVRVVDIKESRGSLFAVCDGGMHHHLAASGNFGQVIRKNYPIVNVELREGAQVLTNVVGPLCTPLDMIADKTALDPLAPGSLLAVLQSGAYGFTASPHRFLSHPPCAEIIV